MAGAFWQNPKFSARFNNPVSPVVDTADTSPTPEATALYAANAAAAAARAEAAEVAINAYFSSFYVEENGFLKIIPSKSGTLPPDVTLNGDIYIAGATALPEGLSSNNSVIMTDGSVYYPGTYSNGGVLAVNPNATGA